MNRIKQIKTKIKAKNTMETNTLTIKDNRTGNEY